MQPAPIGTRVRVRSTKCHRYGKVDTVVSLDDESFDVTVALDGDGEHGFDWRELEEVNR